MDPEKVQQLPTMDLRLHFFQYFYFIFFLTSYDNDAIFQFLRGKYLYINPFHANVSILYPLKMPESQKSSGDFKEL